jgi:hypothetical protein
VEHEEEEGVGVTVQGRRVSFPHIGINRRLVTGTVCHPSCKGIGSEHGVAMEVVLVNIGEVGRALPQHFFVGSRDKHGITLVDPGSGRYQNFRPSVNGVWIEERGRYSSLL